MGFNSLRKHRLVHFGSNLAWFWLSRCCASIVFTELRRSFSALYARRDRQTVNGVLLAAASDTCSEISFDVVVLRHRCAPGGYYLSCSRAASRGQKTTEIPAFSPPPRLKVLLSAFNSRAVIRWPNHSGTSRRNTILWFCAYSLVTCKSCAKKSWLRNAEWMTWQDEFGR